MKEARCFDFLKFGTYKFDCKGVLRESSGIKAVQQKFAMSQMINWEAGAEEIEEKSVRMQAKSYKKVIFDGTYQLVITVVSVGF